MNEQILYYYRWIEEIFSTFLPFYTEKRNRFCLIWKMYILIDTWMSFEQITNKVVMIYIGINLVIKALRERKHTWEWLFYTIVLKSGDFTFPKDAFSSASSVFTYTWCERHFLASYDTTVSIIFVKLTFLMCRYLSSFRMLRNEIFNNTL